MLGMNYGFADRRQDSSPGELQKKYFWPTMVPTNRLQDTDKRFNE